jgi:hypothetical protein
MALAMIERTVEAGHGSDPWVARRHELLRVLLYEGVPIAEGRPSVLPAARRKLSLGDAVIERLRARDLHGALGLARQRTAATPADGDAAALVSALGRLVAAIDRASAQDSGDPLLQPTTPLQGHDVVLFQLRMGNLDLAERVLRKIVLEEPLDRLARERLADCETIRRVIEGVASTQSSPPEAALPLDVDDADRTVTTATVDERVGPAETAVSPLAATSPRLAAARSAQDERTPMADVHIPVAAKKPTSPELLKKRTRRPTGDAGYATTAAAGGWDDDPSTKVTGPEIEAELLLKQGYAERALKAFKRLAKDHPEERRYADRVREIGDLIGSGQVPIAAELTVRRHVSQAMPAAALRTGMRSSAPPHAADRGSVRICRIISVG